MPPEIVQAINTLMIRFEKFIKVKIEHLPSLFLICISALNLQFTSVNQVNCLFLLIDLDVLRYSQTIANTINKLFEYLLKEVREDATNIIFATIDYLALTSTENFAPLVHNILAKVIYLP